MNLTNIDWTHRPGTIGTTWNVVTGCNKESRGCKNCYAEVMHNRLQAMGQDKYQQPFLAGPVLHPDLIQLPLSWKKPRTVFVNSMSDLFHKDVPFHFIGMVFNMMAATPQHTYIVNPSHGGHCSTTENPCPVIIARQDKAPLYLVQSEAGLVQIAVYNEDSEVAIRIKQFMVLYGLVDIKMRMLRVKELLLIQGFPEDYKMAGNQSDHKKFIGNSVHPMVPKAWGEVMAAKRLVMLNLKAA